MTHSFGHPPASQGGSGSHQPALGMAVIATATSLGHDEGGDSVESYFECITTCSLDDGECITQCVEQLREHH
ncbi:MULTISPECIES: hypothetical protein [unclassified Synechococcus]|uniref:hypothetical protein n=1 Tax=unclassified Synechococcus TaxID=2626047 RepID=UPI00006993FF|nr:MULTISPECIES: hypothetical protein [unclassified Synechococcus]EAQ76334.1 hypothetical protein WH5701_16046 [Synechococcus sp. WH 5701]WFN60637.1 hypothetical protein N4320_14820 [Synechococcus sp. CCFWC 502]CAK6693036.1 hypothetical protein ICNINCKA_01332 [Synechococcus sp. CBW1107]